MMRDSFVRVSPLWRKLTGGSARCSPGGRELIVRSHGSKHPRDGRRSRFWLGSVALIVLAGGCGNRDGLGRRPVDGVVRLDGKPLAQGLILFEPSPGSISGTAVGGKIRAGRFAISEAEGPVVGDYLVRIYASSGAQAPPTSKKSIGSPRPMVDLIPAAYNTSTELKVKVSADQSISFEFLLSSDPKSPLP